MPAAGATMTFTQKRRALAARRELLVRRAQQQRVELELTAAPLVQAMGWVERGVRLVQRVSERPWLVLAPALVLALWRPRFALRLLPATLALWRVARSAYHASNNRKSTSS